MSIGGVVPISTRARVSRSDCCASSSDWRCTASEAIAYARSQYALRSACGGGDRLPELDVGDLAVLLRLTDACCRVESMLKLRNSGCVTLNDSPDRICGENFVKMLFVVDREPSHDAL